MSTEDEKFERFASTLADAISYVANEALLLARMEEFFEPKPATLWNEENKKYIHDKLDKSISHLGGPPKVILIKDGDPPPECDTYPQAVLEEVITAFDRARKSVARAHLFMLGSKMLSENPEVLNQSENEKFNTIIASFAEDAFWEHAETAYIRLVSFWDRVGQVLDFAFFRIRQFERDGFSAVLDRIHTNILQLNTNLGQSGSWKSLRQYQTSEREDGLKWLLQRRNITIHSLHLRASVTPIDEVAFKPMYNHLEEKLKSKLSPRTPVDEIEQLHVHLTKAAHLFVSFLDVVEYGYQLYKRD